MQILIVGLPYTKLLRVTPKTTTEELAAAVCVSADARHEIWFQHRGRKCREGQSLRQAGICEGSTVHAHLRLRGGGGDGGATGAESRSSYLEMYMQKKPDKVNPAEEKLARWTTCKLSGETLQPPCVVDELGSLYNKEAVISALVSKSMPASLGHITSLKHVKDAILTPSASLSRSLEATAQDFQPGNDVQFQCPISGQPLNGQYRFLALLPSGHIVSEKAVKQVPIAVEEFVGLKWEEARPLNGTQEEVEQLWDLLIAGRALTKKSKKEKRKAADMAAVETTTPSMKELERRSSSENSPATTTERKVSGQDWVGKANGKHKVQDFSAQDSATAKKIKAKDMAPAHADKKVWASLFTSTHGKQAAETYSCRSTSARGWV